MPAAWRSADAAGTAPAALLSGITPLESNHRGCPLSHLGPSLQVLRLPHPPGLHPWLVDLVLLVRGVVRASACV